MKCTPLALPVSGSTVTSRTTALVRSVKLPVSIGGIDQAGRRIERGVNVAAALAFAGAAAEDSGCDTGCASVRRW